MYIKYTCPYYVNTLKSIVPNPSLPSSMQKWIHESSDSLTLLGDFNASYNTFPYTVNPNVEIVIKGQFPYARYLSYSVIGKSDLTIATILDQDLLPDPSSMNPFLPGANCLQNTHGTIVLRIYAPSIGYDDITGGVGFPPTYFKKYYCD